MRFRDEFERPERDPYMASDPYVAPVADPWTSFQRKKGTLPVVPPDVTYGQPDAPIEAPWSQPAPPPWMAPPDVGVPPGGGGYVPPAGGYTGGDFGGGGGGGFGSFVLPPYTGPTSPQFNLPGAPVFDPGVDFTPPPGFEAPEFNPSQFRAPGTEEAMNEPGYQFRVGQGLDALQRSAAAKGVLRTGGTLKDIVGYGQNFAAQEYDKVFNRALQGYDAQYGAERDAYQARYAGDLAEYESRYKTAADKHRAEYEAAKDRFAPEFAQYGIMAEAERQRALAEFQRHWDKYAAGLEGRLRQEDLIGRVALPPLPQFYGG
jgi:hypothetical protein